MARPKLGETDTERLHIKITADELAGIDDWRYANRVPSKSQAVRRLVQIGMSASGTLPQMGKDVGQLMKILEVGSETLVDKTQSASTAEEWKELALASIGVMGMVIDEATKLSISILDLAEKSGALLENPDIRAAMEAGRRSSETARRLRQAADQNDLETFEKWAEERPK